MFSHNSVSHRSPNCSESDEPTTMYAFNASSSRASDKDVSSFMLSCQTHSKEGPDAITLDRMKTLSADAFGKLGTDVHAGDIAITAHAIPLGMHSTKSSAEELSRRRMASNCAPHYSLREVTAYNRFECRYLGEGIDDRGRKVRNPFQTWRGTLASCDNSIEISDDVEADVRKLAWHAAGGHEAKLDVNQFLCSIQSIPHN